MPAQQAVTTWEACTAKGAHHRVARNDPVCETIGTDGVSEPGKGQQTGQLNISATADPAAVDKSVAARSAQCLGVLPGRLYGQVRVRLGGGGEGRDCGWLKG